MSVSAKAKDSACVDEALRKYPLAKKGLLYLLDARMREYEDITGKQDIRMRHIYSFIRAISSKQYVEGEVRHAYGDRFQKY